MLLLNGAKSRHSPGSLRDCLAARQGRHGRGVSDQGTATPETPTLKLYVFDCGHAPVHDLALFSLTSEEVEVPQVFVPCYLIEHPEGRLIWDTGIPAIVADSLEGLEVEGFFVTLERTLADQLGDLGLGQSDIDIVASSHLHWDHVAQSGQFTDATHLIQRAEHEAAFVEEPTVPFFVPRYYADLEDNETVLLDGDHDVFGDGRVVIKSTPGHTPGHQCLYLDLAETGPIVLSGDLYHFAASRELSRVPQFNVDEEQTRASMAALDLFLEDTGAELWIQHDVLRARTLRKSPEFYD